VIVAPRATDPVPAAVLWVLTVPEVPVRDAAGEIAPVSATVQPEPEITMFPEVPPVTVQVPTSAAGIPVPEPIDTLVPTG
jgi:hypothetical protein